MYVIKNVNFSTDASLRKSTTKILLSSSNRILGHLINKICPLYNRTSIFFPFLRNKNKAKQII